MRKLPSLLPSVQIYLEFTRFLPLLKFYEFHAKNLRFFEKFKVFNTQSNFE